ncbi:DUF1071 domain-containing protein, partial [Citrobacter sp. TBCS-14]|uniref:Sak single strand annealing protein n=1 Tax=Citrobacter sp. TBCS-14 TaxID=2576409 RepID=UPI001135CC36
CLVKAIARHGLGLYIYMNEDLPDLTEEQKLLEAEKQRLREIQPALKRAEELGYPNMEPCSSPMWWHCAVTGR